ncbi:hypothetical protein [Virgibacillus sp. DJP39]|uniref:hypothetical protein n=1 Tax=Virgibacillus sp. DJP39 TaxID=3409790 RepID=UPI003BB4BF52
MPLEQEFIGLLTGGFFIVIGLVMIVTVLLWTKNKNYSSGYVWILLHLILFSVAAYFFLEAISSDYSHPMASEENSFQLGLAGVVWALSMSCLVIGLVRFSKDVSNIT